MELTRRRLMVLAGAAAATALCGKVWAEEPASNANPAPTPPAPAPPASQPGELVIDAGPLSDFQESKVYAEFREQGFFIIRNDKQLSALSSVCTHKGCKVRAQEDQTFLCKCHGSRFDRDGVVTKGPAQRNLPRLEVAEGSGGRLLVRKSD